MKNIAYCIKITEEQYDFLMEFIEKLDFFSPSEFIRFAIRIYLKEIANEHNLFTSLFFSHIHEKRKKQFSFKASKGLIKRLDQFCIANGLTRSKGIRCALDFAINVYLADQVRYSMTGVSNEYFPSSLAEKKRHKGGN